LFAVVGQLIDVEGPRDPQTIK